MIESVRRHAYLLFITMVCACVQYAVAAPDIATYSVVQSKGYSPLAYEAAARNFWTADRMKSAKPIEESANFPAIGGSGRSINIDANKPEDNTTETVIPGSQPSNNAGQGRALSLSETFVRTAGRVFMQLNGYTYSCSASVVVSPSARLVVTAAHCVYDLYSRKWMSTNWVFVPGYDEGTAPLGIWVGSYFTTLQTYVSSTSSNPAWNADVAFVVMSPNSGRSIAAVTGSQGIAFNMAYYQPIVSVGYPVNIASGTIMSSCYNKALTPKCSVSGYLGQALRCGMTQGCSGGPWLQNLNSNTAIGYVVSVNSFICGINMLHGPYFGSSISALYDSVKSRL